jgi:hypothetical protein
MNIRRWAPGHARDRETSRQRKRERARETEHSTIKTRARKGAVTKERKNMSNERQK